MVEFYPGYAVGIWYIAEVTEGTTPNSAAYLHLAHKTSLDWGNEGSPNGVRLSGSKDYADWAKGIENPTVNFTINPSQASGKAFIKNHIEASLPFTLLVMWDRGTDVVYIRITGCKVKSGNVKCELYPNAGVVEASLAIWGWKGFFTQSTGSPTFESPPSTFLNWSNVVIKRNTVVVTDWWDFDFSVENELYRNVDDQGLCNGITDGIREVSGTFTRSANDSSGVGSVEYAESVDATNVDLEMALVADLYQFVDCVYNEVRVTAPLDGIIGKKMSWKATSLTIA